MIKVLFIAVLTIHGLIHLMGFTKAFHLAEISQLTQGISRPVGLLWLAAAVLFLATALSYGLGARWWWALGGLALVISQTLVVSAWADAKFGTVANSIVLAAVVLGYGSWRFDATSREELTSLLAQAMPSKAMLTRESLEGLPAPVQTWLRRSNVVGRPPARTVHLSQKGSMRTTPAGDWMSFEARQWFTTDKPGFVWLADVRGGPGLALAGRDTYLGGRGHMVITMMSLVTVADAQGEQIDQGAMVRFLAEMCWFPSAALSPYLEWEKIDSVSARATMRYGGVTASAVFTFNEWGDVMRIEAKRYYSRKDSSSLETWVVETEPDGIGQFEGVRMPVRSTVTWELDDGPFTWMKLEITELTYDASEVP